jgi:plasmid maintenance system antidote protein VapI
MDQALFREVGAALHGPSWQTALAASLGVSARTIRYIASGARPIPRDMETRLAHLLYDHRKTIDALARRLSENMR